MSRLAHSNLARLKLAFPDSAFELHSLIARKLSPEEYTDVQDWVAQCYHKPPYKERLMCALNQVLGGFGVEAVFHDDSFDLAVEYVNMGDAYSVTLLRNEDGQFLIGSWGDYVEDHGI